MSDVCLHFRLAAERRKKVMDQMKNAQKNFMKENKQLYDDTVQKRQRLNTEEVSCLFTILCQIY